MAAATVVAEIDWNNDGDWSDTGEVVTSRVQNRPGIVTVRGRDTIRALGPPAAGSCEFVLNNQSKDYSPEYASSPLYGNLLPGRAVRVRATAPSATGLWGGHLDDLPQDPRLRGGFVRVPALGKLAKLKGVAISTRYYTDVTTSAAFEHTCRMAGLAAAEYTALDTGQTTLTSWWCDQDDAFAMLVKILAAEGPGAAIYEDNTGRITFHSRHYRLLTARCTTSQATFGNAATEPKHSPPFGYEPNLKGVVNECSVERKTATAGTPGTEVWTWTGSVTIAPGATATWDVRASNPGTGYAATFTWTGGGLTHGFVSEDNGAVAASGTHVELRVTNASSPAQAATITAISVTATPYTAVAETVGNTVDTSASRAKYGTRALPGGWAPWPYLDRSVAQGICDAIVNAYQEPRATVRVTVNNGHSTRLTHMLARDISDRVTVVESQTGLNAACHIERIRHAIGEGGRFHATTFDCERIAGDAPGVYDTAVYDTARYGF
jgi:hypothetical protein